MEAMPVFYHVPWSLHSQQAKKILDDAFLEYKTVEATLEVIEGLSAMAEVRIFPVLEADGVFYEGLAQIREFVSKHIT